MYQFEITSYILACYGAFLILCGFTAVTFIGMKAKTALISGGLSGCTALAIAYLVYTGNSIALFAGVLLSAGLLIVFSWRATKTFFRLFEMIATSHPELNKKGIAFMIIGLMAIVSLIVMGTQIVFLLTMCSA